jgi:RHS repeat-associated protein
MANATALANRWLADMPGRAMEMPVLLCNRKIDGTFDQALVLNQSRPTSDTAAVIPRYRIFPLIMDYMQTDHGAETNIYYYHPDHLGSASWITDAAGQPVQHLQYLPYGETRIDQRTASYHERYTFSGKEKDEETGYHYFGARYYNSDLSIWLSVDPMSDKYPSLNPYNYCAWNPLKIIDPNGDTVIIRGEQVGRALSQLQTGNMLVTRSENGVLNVDIGDKTRSDLTNEERLIYDAINSSRVTVEIITGKTELRNGKNIFNASIAGEKLDYICLFGGSNLGSFLYSGGAKAKSLGFIDMDLVDGNGFDQGVAHEVSELYISGCMAIRDGLNVHKAEQHVPNPVLMEAHNKAIPALLPRGCIQQFGIKNGQMGKIKTDE